MGNYNIGLKNKHSNILINFENMIKVTGSGYFTPQANTETAYKVPETGLFLFLFSYANSPSKTENEASISADAANPIGQTRFRLPDYTAEELANGVGSNSHNQLIDKLEDLVITELSAYNLGLTFEKTPMPVSE